MRTTNGLHGAIATCLLLAASSAYAEEPTLTDAPGNAQQACPANQTCPPQTAQAEACPNPNATCPPGGATTTTTTTTSMQGQQQGYAPPAEGYTPPQGNMYPEQHEYRPWYDRIGFGLAVGGGADAFATGTLKNMTDIGGGWTVRATAGTRSFISGELSYIGSAQSITALGLDSNATLVGNGAQGDIRLNLTRIWPVQPFVFGGVAWRHYSLTNENFNVSDVSNSSDVVEVPAGAGLAMYYRGFMLDARGQYSFAWGDNIVPGLSTGDQDRWNATGNVGVEF